MAGSTRVDDVRLLFKNESIGNYQLLSCVGSASANRNEWSGLSLKQFVPPNSTYTFDPNAATLSQCSQMIGHIIMVLLAKRSDVGG